MKTFCLCETFRRFINSILKAWCLSSCLQCFGFVSVVLRQLAVISLLGKHLWHTESICWQSRREQCATGNICARAPRATRWLRRLRVELTCDCMSAVGSVDISEYNVWFGFISVKRFWIYLQRSVIYLDTVQMYLYVFRCSLINTERLFQCDGNDSC